MVSGCEAMASCAASGVAQKASPAASSVDAIWLDRFAAMHSPTVIEASSVIGDQDGRKSPPGEMD